MAVRLVGATDVGSNDAVLDVGCGTGNVAITPTRRGASATGLDITPAMLDEARANAAIAGVEEVSWREGTATDLPFADDAFDVTCCPLECGYGLRPVLWLRWDLIYSAHHVAENGGSTDDLALYDRKRNLDT